MEKYYEMSLKKIKSLDKIPKEKEWNVIAMLEGYLTVESLKYISGMSFNELCYNLRTSS